jgi:hypothetical protein
MEADALPDNTRMGLEEEGRIIEMKCALRIPGHLDV